jgi:ADP-heptose:LPS heptosyltransferase
MSQAAPAAGRGGGLSFAGKRRLDFLLGEPLCVLLNLLARLLGRVLRRDHSLGPGLRRIYIVKLVGLGSVVNATPLLRALREAFPDAKLVFVGFTGLGPLLARLPIIDQRILLRDDGLGALAWDCLLLLVRAWRERPELVIDLEVHARFSTILATLTAARNRAGFAHSTAMFRQGLYTHLLYFNRWAHIVDDYLQLGALLGAESQDTRLVKPALTASDDDEAAAWLAEHSIDGPFVAVNPNVGELCEERRWPSARFARTIEELVALGHGPVVLIGSPAEAADNEAIWRAVATREQVHQAAGGLSLGGTMALLARARLLLTNDSGPLHLAAALDTPTVSLWGPGLPQTYMPRHGEHRILYQPVYCSPCLYLVDVVPCGGVNICMQGIAWETAVRAVLELLGDPRAADYAKHSAPHVASYLAGDMGRPLGAGPA